MFFLNKKKFYPIVFCLAFLFPIFDLSAQSLYKNLSGWAWSSNIGWIAFGSWPDRVRVEPASGNLQGYAWSSNLGWIRFDAYGTYPTTNNTPSHGARLENISGTMSITGWARACSVYQSGCAGGDLKSDIQRGGWDGWIAMNGTVNDNPPSSPDDSYSVTQSGSQLQGKAWGGEVIGWVDFYDSLNTPPRYFVKVDDLLVSCRGEPNPVTEGASVDWMITAIGGKNLLPIGDMYTFQVSLNGGIPISPNPTGNSQKIISLNAPSGTNVARLDVLAQDGTNPISLSGQAFCSVTVNPTVATRNLSINISGNGKVEIDTAAPFSPPNVDLTCLAGANTSCSYSGLTNGNQIQLTASTNDPNQVFRSWSGDVPANCNQPISSSCVVTMNQDRQITATFGLPSGPGGAGEFSITNNVILVDLHNSGLPVRSSAISITNESGTSTPLCVKEIKSKVSNQLLNGTIGPPPTGVIRGAGYDDSYLARCHFSNDDTVGKTCDADTGDVSNVTLAPYGTMIGGVPQDTAAFSITIPKKIKEIKDNSPYEVTIGVCGSVAGDPSDQKIEFRYQPLTFEPQ